ncbi:protein prkA (plasmid) [Pontibacillus sp. ALD_SL1]|uniref:protein prkA n=1 Tax=Pontibacillus sp. ALD_SL1 TaxID=2777185 RepID=UPI001A96C63A|nr:protein prkA [Pontibacillus sp. ALD_SL1]QST02131.1 protein prkA [Pontibacillus sp. ALD_SL1]
MNVQEAMKNAYLSAENLEWEGTFGEYLEMVREHPNLAQNAHSRVYNMILKAGVSVDESGRKVYHFFDDLYGIGETTTKLVESYFKPAALGLDTKKRMLLMMGPVSSGKSTIASLIKKGLEAYSQTDEGALYAIKGCPMNQDPLLLVPEHLRETYEKELGIAIEGELNPYTKLYVKELLEQLDGDVMKLPVKRLLLSEQMRTGIGTFSPSDPKTQDVSELIGSIDFSKISEYGSESDPRAYRFDGELNISNRGVVEFQEILKCDQKFLWNLLSLTQEGNFKAGRFALISADEVILAHTNETEYKKFVADNRNEALRSRMLVVHTPYNLSVEEEVKTYKTIIGNKVNLSLLPPFALQAVAEFSILTRLKDDGKLSEKLDAYQKGEKRSENEGMSGIDPRFIVNVISHLLANADSGIVTAYDLLEGIRDGLHEHPSIEDRLKQDYITFLETAKRRYQNAVREDVSRFFTEQDKGGSESLFARYVEHAKAYMEQTIDRDYENMMREVETLIGVGERAKQGFREEIVMHESLYREKGDSFTLSSHPNLERAIRKRALRDMKEAFRLNEEKIEDVVRAYANEKGCSIPVAESVVNDVLEEIHKTA